jgi:hypothetical protein
VIYVAILILSYSSVKVVWDLRSYCLSYVFLTSFPFDFVAAIVALILINFFRMRGMMKRYGRMKDLFGSLPSLRSGNQNRPLKYYCMSCGKEHNGIAFLTGSPSNLMFK